MIRALVALAWAASVCAASDDLLQIRESWSTLSRKDKLGALTILEQTLDEAVLAQAEKWLGEKDLVVRAAVVRVVAAHVGVERLKPRVQATLARHVKDHMDQRARVEKKEFRDVCRKHGSNLKDFKAEMTAGRPLLLTVAWQ